MTISILATVDDQMLLVPLRSSTKRRIEENLMLNAVVSNINDMNMLDEMYQRYDISISGTTSNFSIGID